MKKSNTEKQYQWDVGNGILFVYINYTAKAPILNIIPWTSPFFRHYILLILTFYSYKKSSFWESFDCNFVSFQGSENGVTITTSNWKFPQLFEFRSQLIKIHSKQKRHFSNSMRTAQISLKNRSKNKWFSFHQFLCPNTHK